VFGLCCCWCACCFLHRCLQFWGEYNRVVALTTIGKLRREVCIRHYLYQHHATANLQQSQHHSHLNTSLRLRQTQFVYGASPAVFSMSFFSRFFRLSSIEKDVAAMGYASSNEKVATSTVFENFLLTRFVSTSRRCWRDCTPSGQHLHFFKPVSVICCTSLFPHFKRSAKRGSGSAMIGTVFSRLAGLHVGDDFVLEIEHRTQGKVLCGGCHCYCDVSLLLFRLL